MWYIFVTDREIINAFVVYLRNFSHPGLSVDQWPEDTNRNSPDIDAIAGPYAIEHTSVDYLPNQRRDSDWFMRVTEGLEQEFSNIIQFRLNIRIEYDAIVKGQNWPAIREALMLWIKQEAPRLLDGRHNLQDIPGVPLQIHITKASNRSPGVFFARYLPEDDTLSNRIQTRFDCKAKKLVEYQRTGITTILLVENNDIALISESKMIEAIRQAYPYGFPPGIDKIWYVDTSIPSEIEFRDLTAEL